MLVLASICLGCVLLSASMSPVLQEAEEEAEVLSRHHLKPQTWCQRLGCIVLGEELFYHPNLSTFLLIALADAIGNV